MDAITSTRTPEIFKMFTLFLNFIKNPGQAGRHRKMLNLYIDNSSIIL